MAGSFRIDGSDIIIEKDGRVVLDTSLDLMNLVPSAAITLTAHDIAFPSLKSGVIYHQTRVTIPSFPTDVDAYGCASFAGIIAQEWGPAESSPYTLADETLGTVPAGTDYLDVMVNLARTVTPPGWFDLSMRSDFPSGQWVKLEGGSCLIEEFPGMRRLFEIFLDGTTVKLRRYQSVTAAGPVDRSYIHGTGNVVGYFAGTDAPQAGGQKAIYGATIQIKGPDSGPNHRPPGAAISQDPCSTTGLNYASTWTGDIIITPGRIGA